MRQCRGWYWWGLASYGSSSRVSLRWREGGLGINCIVRETGMHTVYRTVLLLLVLLLSGCAEMPYRMTELAGVNCRPDIVQQHGGCVSSRGASK